MIWDMEIFSGCVVLPPGTNALVVELLFLVDESTSTGVGNLLYQKSHFGISPTKKKSFGAANFLQDFPNFSPL